MHKMALLQQQLPARLQEHGMQKHQTSYKGSLRMDFITNTHCYKKARLRLHTSEHAVLDIVR